MVSGDKTAAQNMRPDVAALAMDLHRMGVRWEVQEEPVNWLAPKEPKPQPVFTPPVVEPKHPQDIRMQPAVQEHGDVSAVMAPAPVVQKVALALKKPEEIVEEVVKDVRVWKDGATGGVVLVVRSEAPLENGDMTLLQGMLAAVGLDKEPMGWVGAMLPDDMFTKDMEEKIGAEVAAMEPRHVLVLGSAMLGSWLGKNRGVEGWVSGSLKLAGLADGVPVGVTYAPAMLRQKPLFKRLAWKHLLAGAGN